MDKITKGIYCLVIALDKPISFTFKGKVIHLTDQGFLLYVGSALGKSSSLENRIQRHFRDVHLKTQYWHIDSLLAKPEVQIQTVYFFETSDHLECTLYKFLVKPLSDNNLPPILGFGSSDCQNNCKSHLLHTAAPFQKIQQTFSKFTLSHRSKTH